MTQIKDDKGKVTNRVKIGDENDIKKLNWLPLITKIVAPEIYEEQSDWKDIFDLWLTNFAMFFHLKEAWWCSSH